MASKCGNRFASASIRRPKLSPLALAVCTALALASQAAPAQTTTGSVQGLGFLVGSGSSSSSQANAVNSDGTVVVGSQTHVGGDLRISF